MSTLKSGTRIEVRGQDAGLNTVWEPAKIARRTKVESPKASTPKGYHLVRFNDGGRLLVHESRFRVIGNAA